MVELGGNRGTFLAQILENYSNIQHGLVFDLSHIINQVNNGEEFNSREIHKDRWSFISGDMLDSSTIPEADAYMYSNIFYTVLMIINVTKWSDKQLANIWT